MYNGIKNQTDLEKGMAKGGIKTPRGFKTQEPGASQVIPLQSSGVKVYKPIHGQGMGPIYTKPLHYTVYDLITNPDDADLRYNSFEDWVFPDIKRGIDCEDRQVNLMMPQRVIRRGSDRSAGENSFITNNSVTQYLYILLNTTKNIVQSFGDFNGMTIRRSDYMVCVEVGNPATGRLDGAFIQYALSLQTPIRECVTLSTTIPDPENGGYRYLYNIHGDQALEKEIFDRWFNSGDYYFNAVIYPKIRAFTNA